MADRRRAGKFLVATFLLLAAGLICAACSSSRSILLPNLQFGERRAAFEHKAEVFHLSTNQLTVLLIPDRNTNLVKVDARYPVGALDDPEDKAGLAHLIEHLTFSTRHQGAEGPALIDLLSRSALRYNAFTSHEATQYSSVAMADQVSTLLAVEAFRMRSRCEAIDDGDLALAREVVRNEVRQSVGVGREMVEAFQSAVYGADHPYSRPLGGTDQSIASIERDDVCAFLRSHYGPSSAFLVVSGNIESAAIKKLVAAQFGRIPAQAETERSPPTRASLRGSASRHQLAVEQATAIIAFEAPRLLDREAIAGRLARKRLRQDLSSLVREHSFIVDIDTGLRGGHGAPIHYVAVSVDSPDKLAQAVDLVFEKAAAVGKGMSPVSFADLRNSERAVLISSIESFYGQANVYIKYLVAGDDRQFVQRDLNGISALTKPALQTYALHYFDRQSSHVAYFYPKEGAKIAEKRADSSFESNDYHTQDWRQAVDPSEAERPLPLLKRKPRAKFWHFSLDNGIRVYLAPSLSYPVVDIRVVFPAGRAHDPTGKQGLAQLAALLMEPEFRESDVEEFTTIGAFNMEKTRYIGGEYYSDVADTTTSFRMRGLSIYGDGLLWRLYFLLSAAHYDKSTLAKFRKRIEDNADAASDPPTWPRLVMAALFGKDYPLGLRGLTRESLARISIDDLEEFRDQHYQPAKAAIIITGFFDAEYMETEIRRLFGPWQGIAGPKPRPMPQPTKRLKAAYFAEVDDEEIQTNIIMAFRTEPNNLARGSARLVLEEILRDKLRIMRNQLGATYGAQVDYWPLRGTGLLLIAAAVDRERAGEAFVAMRKAMDEIRAGDFIEEFVRARRLVVQNLLAATINSRTVANQLEQLAMHGIESSDHDKLVQKVAELRPRDISDLIALELAAEREVVVAQGRKESVTSMYRAANIAGYKVIE